MQRMVDQIVPLHLNVKDLAVPHQLLAMVTGNCKQCALHTANRFQGFLYAASSSTADAGNQLATPTDFTVDENGSYSFTGVEDAEYYLLYFCDPTATGDDDR